jgi:hypothetical protein
MSPFDNNNIKIIFAGNRYDSHTLPVNAAQDLCAYEALLIELAKALFFKDNPSRQRIPKGFSDVYLAIKNFNAGSLETTLAIMPNKVTESNSPSPLFPPESYFVRAHDTIVNYIASPGDVTSDEFPKKLLAHFNRFGRSLKDNESIQLVRSDNGKTAVLSQMQRKNLVLTAGENYEREVEIFGSVIRAYGDKGILVLKQDNDSKVEIPFPPDFKNYLNDFFDSPRNLVALTGIGTFDAKDTLLKIISINSFELIKNAALAVKFDHLAQIEDGWYDGDGVALDADDLQAIATIFIENFPDSLPIPQIVPTFDGNILVEWNVEGYPSIEINIAKKSANFQIFGIRDNDDLIEKEFDLANKGNIEHFFSYLQTHIKPASVE